MSEPHPTDAAIRAITEQAHCSDAVEYAAKHVRWAAPIAKKTHAKYVALNEELTAPQRQVLEWLRLQGHMQTSSFYEKDYLPGPTLEKAIDTVRETAREERLKQTKAQVHWIYTEAGYDSEMEYAACEIPWQEHSKKPFLQFTIDEHQVHGDQRVVLDHLVERGDAYRHAQEHSPTVDYRPREELRRMIRDTQQPLKHVERILGRNTGDGERSR